MFTRKGLISISFFFTVLILSFGCSSDSETLKLSPSKLDFGSIYIGDTLKIDVELKNKYGKQILITNIVLSGSNNYVITAGANIPLSLDNGATHILSIVFTPTADAPINGLLSIIHDASTKTKEAELIGIGVAVPRIDVPVVSHDFDIRLTGTTTTEDFEIHNIGTKSLNISQYTFSGVGASVYSVSAGGTIPTIVNPGATHTVTVAFEPIIVGNYPAELSIYHDAINAASPVIITLDAEAVLTAAKIVLNQTSPWDFGAYPTSFPGLATLEIESAGTTDLTVTSLTFLTGTVFSLEKIEDSNACPVTLPKLMLVGTKIFATIKFAPNANSQFNDTLTIVHDGLYNPSPLDIAVTGQGRAPTDVTISYTGSIVSWTVPAGVTTIRIETWGGQGGTGGAQGGKGARMRGDFAVSPGDTLKIIVGQYPGVGSTSCLGGGGGGTYVWKDGANDPMIVAGAGGGSGYGSGASPGVDAVISQNGTDGNGTYAVGGAGTNGNGGVVPAYPQRIGGGGAGWKSDGCPGNNSASGTDAEGGKCPANGGAGGLYGGSSGSNQTGGFGGGGGSQGRNTCSAAGGGGGYSGGGPGAENPNSVSYQTASGGGGGSYNDGANQDNSAGINTGNGKVMISY